ncbi:hypothetical protein GH733_003738, partial [Mirounga leonina]
MPMECKKFEKAFPCSLNLAKCIQFHMRDTHCVCKECSKEFTCFPKLNIHIVGKPLRIHSIERTFECKEYGKSFRYSLHFSQHNTYWRKA